MFEATTADGAPMTVRASFWEWMKAGVAFSMGAAIVAGIITVLKLLTLISALQAFVQYLGRH